MYYPSQSKRKITRQAFTLIELLVVIAIISILAAILFPVFAQAKASAKKSVCLSNLKQISLGFVMYQTDNDECYPMGNWWGEIIGSGPSATFNPSSGIQPYMKSWQIIDCPSGAALIANPLAPFSYSVNYNLVSSPTGNYTVGTSDIALAAETILLMDAAQIVTSPSVSAARNALFFNGYKRSVTRAQGRHSADTVAIGWADGHAKSQKVQYQPFSSTTASAAQFQTTKLGLIMKRPMQQASYPADDCKIGNVSDWYYYFPIKDTLDQPANSINAFGIGLSPCTIP